MSETLKNNKGIYVVGGNIIVLLLYTLLCKTIGGGILLDAGFIFIQVVFSICFAIAEKSWYWLLSALIVLLIGVSTCVNFVSN